MKEYTITLSYVVDARDHDEAVEIVKSVRNTVVVESDYRLRQVETSKIEET
jgi:hypothetical protein